ncbi:MAG: 50S ribosomal protein L17 [Planctomycetota bacterium]|nr:50S ribosomal protein L17 [Planctomycetaceae bacterium]MDQ3332841.1 50S ribosomal protein L17 [Planctomycetota bacterium]
MRHRMKGRKLGRNSSHRKALFKNMATALILTARPDEDDPAAPKVAGRIVTTVAKAKELRPKVEKLITMARKARVHEQQAEEFATRAERGTDAWKNWREGDQWQKWVNAKSPAIAMRRRAFSVLRSKEAVDILFDELAERFETRDGGYTRVVRLPTRRLGDGGQKAIIEFTGERDRPKASRAKAPVVKKEAAVAEPAPAESTEEKSEA